MKLQILSKFSRKQQIILCVSVVLAVGINYWIGSWQDVGHLVSQLEEGDLETQVQAAEKLGDLGSRSGSAISALSNAVTHPEYEIRAAAIPSLVRLSRRDAVHAFSRALTHRDQGVRLDAREALERMGTPAAQAALASYSSGVRKQYQRASLGAWAEKFRRNQKQKKKQDYRRFKRAYNIHR